MPSFFEGLKRLIQGKPVFTEGDAQSDTVRKNDIQVPPASQAPVQNQTSVPRPGPKYLPLVVVDELDCRENGDKMECWSILKNESSLTIELDKVRMLGGARELDNWMRPGEEKQFLLYSGKRPTNTSNQYAELIYKDPNGDYFSAMHFITFEKLDDGTFTVREMRFQPPVRDV